MINIEEMKDRDPVKDGITTPAKVEAKVSSSSPADVKFISFSLRDGEYPI